MDENRTIYVSTTKGATLTSYNVLAALHERQARAVQRIIQRQNAQVASEQRTLILECILDHELSHERFYCF